MWPKFYRDYKEHDPMVKEQVRPSRGIVGCEMHDQNGWGDMRLPYRPNRGAFVRFLNWLFGSKEPAP